MSQSDTALMHLTSVIKEVSQKSTLGCFKDRPSSQLPSIITLNLLNRKTELHPQLKRTRRPSPRIINFDNCDTFHSARSTRPKCRSRYSWLTSFREIKQLLSFPVRSNVTKGGDGGTGKC